MARAPSNSCAVTCAGRREAAKQFGRARLLPSLLDQELAARRLGRSLALPQCRPTECFHNLKERAIVVGGAVCLPCQSSAEQNQTAPDGVLTALHLKEFGDRVLKGWKNRPAIELIIFIKHFRTGSGPIDRYGAPLGIYGPDEGDP